jgi:hypothetical protein
MQDIRITTVSSKPPQDCRGEMLTEHLVSYTVGGKGFQVQVFYGEQDGWYTMTAHLDNAIAAYAGRDYFAMNGETRRKLRKEVAEKIVRFTKKYLNK